MIRFKIIWFDMNFFPLCSDRKEWICHSSHACHVKKEKINAYHCLSCTGIEKSVSWDNPP
jgi:hypothetical protein